MKPRSVEHPVPGYFLVRLVRGGVLVPAAINCDFGLWSCSIQGVDQGPSDEDPARVEGLFRIWHWGKMIERAEYLRLLTRGPAADPNQPVDLANRSPLF